MIDAPRMFVHLLAAGCGPRPTPRGLRAASPLTEVHRPRARQAVDVVGAPAYDPKLSWPRFAVVLHLVQWGFGVVAPLQNNGPNAVEIFNAHDRVGGEQHHIGILSFLDRSHAGRAA